MRAVVALLSLGVAAFSTVFSIAVLTGGCGGPEVLDAGLDSGPRDAGVDSGPADSGPPDAGLVDPTGEMQLIWSQRITSELRLGGAAEARLALLPGDAIAMSLTLSGAPAQYAAGTPEETEIGTGLTQATQVVSTWEGGGRFLGARLVADEDTSVLDGFAALGYGLGAHSDGTLFVAGRFEAGARFGVTDPLAVSFATVREMPSAMVTVTSAEGYLARFDTTPSIEWARRGRSDSGFSDLRFTDVVVLADGSTIVTGLFVGAITLGEGETNETTFAPTAGAGGEVFFARFDPDGALVWASRLVGQSAPGRLALFDDGTFANVFRYNDGLTIGVGETNERALPEPPDGTIAWDALARFAGDGTLMWARPLGSEATTYPGFRTLIARADGSVTVAGTFRGVLDWVDSPMEPLRINAIDGVLAHLSATGELMWQTRITPLRDLQVQAMAPTADGAGTWLVVTVGQSGLALELADTSIFELERGLFDSRLALLRLDGAGVVHAAQLLAAVEVDADELELTPSGDLVLVGRFGDGTALEPGTTAVTPLPTASAFRNVFLARYRPR